MILGVALVVAYTAIAVSPLKGEIGRRSPALASFFSAPTFNYGAVYERGNVLEFHIGMSRDAFVQALEANYSNVAAARSTCGGDSGYRPMYVTMHDREDWDKLVRRDVVCVYVRSKSMVMFFYFTDDALSRVKISVVRMESI